MSQVDEILDSLNIESTALKFARSQGMESMALRGPGNEFIENMFRARYASVRPQINRALTTARSEPVQRLGGDVVTGMSRRNERDVTASVMASGASAAMAAGDMATSMQERAAGAMLNVYSQVDQMALQASLARQQLEAQQGGWLDTAINLGSLGAAIL